MAQGLSNPDSGVREAEIRPFSGSLEDLEALTRVRNETLKATTLPEDYTEFGPGEMNAFYSQGGFELPGNAWLLYAEAEPVGAAILYPSAAFQDRPPGNFHQYVVPGVWRHGLGSQLLHYIEARAVEQGYPVLETTIAAEDEKSTRFLLDRGFTVVGHSRHLAREGLDHLPDALLPTGYEVRSLAETEGDTGLYIETANRLGAYDGSYSLIREEDLARQLDAGTFQPEGVFFLSEATGRIVGVIRATLTHDGKRGYLNEIRLEPSSRGKGLGLAVVTTALGYLAARGVRRVELDTPGENASAYNLALRSGFTEVRRWQHFLKQLNGQS